MRQPGRREQDISLQPRVSYNQSRNNRYHSDTSGEQYPAMIDWSPQWLHSLAALQLSSNWNRSRMFSGFGPTIQSMQRSYTGTFTMRWGAGVGPASFRSRTPLPGQVASTGVANAAKDPVNGHSAAAAPPLPAAPAPSAATSSR